ncbi:hypothetical protein OIU74_002727 [Salix koriyanagi]|uniref:Uncharacterized protein n=1 Tax=Salix koriyanagi TaxID=2511006 RepID=A0A9Q0X7X3_9ROSI|nr:hypothetical protein OIU74_002727 [Salix koriyanagi]
MQRPLLLALSPPSEKHPPKSIAKPATTSKGTLLRINSCLIKFKQLVYIKNHRLF